MAESTPRGLRQPLFSSLLYSYHCWRRNFFGRRLATALRWKRPALISGVRVGFAWALWGRGPDDFSTILTSASPLAFVGVAPAGAFFVLAGFAGFSGPFPLSIWPMALLGLVGGGVGDFVDSAMMFTLP